MIMEIWHGYSIRHGRFVRCVFFAAALFPWPFFFLSVLVREWELALGALAFGVFATCNYRRMRHFTRRMERWTNRTLTEDAV